MTLQQSDIIEAVRLNDALIDPDTGEILSEHDIGIDVLALQLKDAQEQVKSWEQAVALLKLAIGKKLDDAHVKASETPYGVAVWRIQNRRSAKAENIQPLIGRFGLTMHDLSMLYQCATTLDPKQLDALRQALIDAVPEGADPGGHPVVAAIDELIEQKTVAYVLLTPLRKVAPRIERVEVDS